VTVSERTALASDRARDVPAGARHGALATGHALAVVAILSAAAAVVNVLVGVQLPAPWSLPDELIYSEMAKSLADGSLPAVRDESTWGYGVLYPLLIAPAWGVFDDPADAYVAAKVINGIVMALSAFPAFFLARRFVPVRAALVVSGFSVFIPSMLYTGSLLTEVALYPAFLLALLGIVATVQNPTVTNQLLAVGGIGLACLAKPLAVVLVPAFVMVTLHLGVLDRRSGGSVRARLRTQSTALCLLGAIAAIAVVVPALLGEPTAALGSYGVVLGHVDLTGTLVWFVRHVAELDLYVAIAPFAASLVLVCLGVTGRADRRTREFAAVLVWVFGAMLLAVAAYSSEPVAGGEGYAPTEARLHERNVFVLVPLLLIGLALFFDRGRPGGRPLKITCLGVGVLLPVLLPLDRLIHNANLQALAIIPWAAESIRHLWPLTSIPLALAASLALVAKRPSPVLAWVVVGAVFGVTTMAAQASQSSSSVGRSTVGVGTTSGWIDAAVPPGTDVLALWITPGTGADLGVAYRTIWMSEFYNRTVGTLVEVGQSMPYALPHVDGTLRDGILSDEDGSVITARFVFAPCWVRVRGSVVARDPRTAARVYRVPPGAISVAGAADTAPECISAAG
jgi:hypothetical protein